MASAPPALDVQRHTRQWTPDRSHNSGPTDQKWHSNLCRQMSFLSKYIPLALDWSGADSVSNPLHSSPNTSLMYAAALVRRSSKFPCLLPFRWHFIFAIGCLLCLLAHASIPETYITDIVTLLAPFPPWFRIISFFHYLSAILYILIKFPFGPCSK